MPSSTGASPTSLDELLKKVNDMTTNHLSEKELDYLESERRFARVATSTADGLPQVTPVGMWRYNRELGTIDIGGRDFASTRKFRNVQSNAQAAMVVDDLASTNPWRPRAVMIQGRAEAMPEGGANGGAIIRLHPDNVVSWGLD